MPIARCLGKKVINNCAGKLKPYLVELSQSNESVLCEYGPIVASILQETSDSMEKNIITAAETMVRHFLLLFLNFFFSHC